MRGAALEDKGGGCVCAYVVWCLFRLSVHNSSNHEKF